MTGRQAPAIVIGVKNGPYVTREQAATWFLARGFKISGQRLAVLAHQDKGPPYGRLGKLVYYREADLQTWLEEALRPVPKGRSSSRKA